MASCPSVASQDVGASAATEVSKEKKSEDDAAAKAKEEEEQRKTEEEEKQVCIACLRPAVAEE